MHVPVNYALLWHCLERILGDDPFQGTTINETLGTTPTAAQKAILCVLLVLPEDVQDFVSEEQS